MNEDKINQAQDAQAIQDEFMSELESLRQKRDEIISKYKGKLTDKRINQLHNILDSIYG